jgi:retinol dehydrogenase-14
VDDIEMTFAVNHLGGFLLTNVLLDLIVRSAPARIITVSSVGHRDGTIDFDDLGFAQGYSIMRAYSRSKLANVLFANALAQRLAGTGVTSNSLHPGAVDTRIWSGAPLWAKPFIQIARWFFEKDKMIDPSPLAMDAALGSRLWDVSAAMVHLTP